MRIGIFKLSDERIAPKMIETMMEAVSRTGAELFVCGYSMLNIRVKKDNTKRLPKISCQFIGQTKHHDKLLFLGKR